MRKRKKPPRLLRLSPNEEAQLLREEHDRRRKLRIQQVREQARTAALHIRADVRRRRERELQLLAEELRQDWELQQREKIEALQRLYEESLRLLGQGHRSAKENEPDWEAMAQQAEENQLKAKRRYREALKELMSQRHRDQEEHNRPANTRRKALQVERERAARVASLPLPPPHPIETIEANRPHAGRADVTVFSATHHHRLEPTVDREVPGTQPDAHEEAQQEARRLQEWRSEAEQQREEQQEKARLRGRSALRREQLTQDRERLVVELDHMQQTELLRRRQQVAQMPVQIFQPLHQRREAREDGQRDMEFAFEDMYTGERRVKGDLVLQLVPQPLPAPSTASSQDQELDVTVDDGEDTPLEVKPLEVTLATEASHHGNGHHPGPAAEPGAVDPPRPAPRQALRKLLDRIRTQRDQVLEPIRTQRDQGRDHGRDQVLEPIRTHQDQVLEPIKTQGDQESEQVLEPIRTHQDQGREPPVNPDEAAEWDSSINTGSLSVVEPGREASGPRLLPEAPSALETTEESSVVAPLPPEVRSSRVEEWKRREEALEQEKRQQMVLLEELEEQKARLEDMLLDAQRQREGTRATITQEVPLLHEQEVPAHDHEVNPNAPTAASVLEGAMPQGHSSRILKHQQRLLEQNRIHRRSVEVAQQRLEQYLRALQIRHNTATAPRPPAAALIPRLPLCPSATVSMATPPAPQSPTDCAAPPSTLGEILTGESDIWSGPPPAHLPRPSSRPGTGPPASQRAGLSAWLTDGIMERATGHLPERLRPPPVAPNPFVHRSLGTTEMVAAGIQQSYRPGPLLRPPRLPWPQAPREGDMERQRRKLPDAHRWMQEQREEVEQQLWKQEEEQPRREEERRRQEEQRRREEERWRKEERCRQEEEERQDEQWRQEDQQRWKEEERWRREEQQRKEEQRRRDEEQREQVRMQREALQALINTETPNPPVAEALETGEEEVGRRRLHLLSSLLRAIEESHGGSLSHLEDRPQLASCTPPPHTSDPASRRIGLDEPPQSRAAPPPPPQAQKPPLTRVKLGTMVTLPGQHELSVIREVETPGDCSLVVTEPEDSMGSQPLAPVGAPGRPRALLTHVAEQPAVCSPQPALEPSTEGSWRERLLEHPPETEPGSPRLSWRSCDQAGGSSGSPGSVSNGYTTNSECVRRAAYPNSRSSSASLSTGSYVTTDPEHNSAHTDISEPHSGAGLRRQEAPTTSFLSAPSSPPALSSSSSCNVERSLAGGSPGPQTSMGQAVAALFQDSSIQRIIDKYTRELNASLCTTADTTGSSVARQENQGNQVPLSPAQIHTTTPHLEMAPPRPGLEWDHAVNQVLEQFCESVSLVQDISFRPLIGQPVDQSSCLATEGRDSAVASLIGQPAAHSSMIGQLPGQSLHAGANQAAWDSTLSRMIGRLSHHPSSHWSSGGRDFYSSQLIGRLGLEQSSVWLDEGQESGMRPLIGQLDESAVQRPGSSGTGGLGSSVDPTGSEPVQVLEDPPEPPHHWPSAPHSPSPPHQPSSHWPSGGRDLQANQLIGRPGLEQSSLWLDDRQEEGGMKSLIGQLDESAGQVPGSSGESSSSLGSAGSVLVAPPPPPAPPDPVQVPEPPHHQSSASLSPPHQPSSHWPSGGRDFYTSQRFGPRGFEQSSLWLDDGQEEGGMKPLIGQLDESAGQAAGSSGYGSCRTDQTRPNKEHLDTTGGLSVGGSAQAAVDLDADPVPGVLDAQSRPTLQDPGHPLQQDSEVFAAQDSFHPLLAEVTHNETLEPSMTFHLPQQEVPSSLEGSSQSPGWEEAASTGKPLSTHLGEENDSLVDPSTEYPRAQEEEVPATSSSSCLDSFCQLTSPQNASQSQSLLLESPEEEEDGETDGCQPLPHDSTSREPTNRPGLTLKSEAPVWDKIIGAVWEKGILEQSEITLLSVSDGTMLGPDASVTEEWEREFDSTLLPGNDPPAAQEESPESHPGVVLELGPGGGLQEAFQRKRLVLIQRSALRVEEIRAKRALANTRSIQTQAKTRSVQTQAKTQLIRSQTGPHPEGQAPGQPVSSETKEPPQVKTKGGGVPVQTAPVPASSTVQKPKHPSPASNAGMKRLEEVRTCAPSQRKLEVSEMHQRTQRLYGQLEEVKQQREVRSRQESYAQNRLKAKEFHQKTLQKLRAKQTAQ